MDNVADDALANCRTVALLNLKVCGFVFVLEIIWQRDWTRWCRRCNVPRRNSRNAFLPNIQSEIKTQRGKFLLTDRLKFQKAPWFTLFWGNWSLFSQWMEEKELPRSSFFGSNFARASRIRRQENTEIGLSGRSLTLDVNTCGLVKIFGLSVHLTLADSRQGIRSGSSWVCS